MTAQIRFLLLSAIGVISTAPAMAQNYQALHGSPYAGSLGAANNPASIAHMPFKWDITPFAIQLKHSTTAFIIKDASLLSPGNGLAEGIAGSRKRNLLANQDLKLFNTRLRLSPQSAVAFGASVRSYISASTSKVNWQEAFADLRNFIDINSGNFPLAAKARGNAWAEIYGTYARSIINKEGAVLTAGITLKVNRGLGAGYVNADDLSVVTGTVNGESGYFVAGGALEYGYSSNFDDLKSNGSFSAIRKQLMQKTFSTLAASIGAEFIIPAAIDGDEDNAYSYDLKVGVSLLDAGYNTYQYSANSRQAILNKVNVSDSVIQAAFENLSSVNDVSDSLQTVAGTLNSISGYFQVFQPMRLVVNADKHLSGNFFINGEVTIPLTAALAIGQKEKLFTRDISLLALTPRYEKKTIGFYLPMLFNTNKQFWIGGAVKAGPLLLGVHNWGNLFGKKSLQNGGGYLAFIFRPGKKQQQADSRQNLQAKKLSRRQQKYLDCPTL